LAVAATIGGSSCSLPSQQVALALHPPSTMWPALEAGAITFGSKGDRLCRMQRGGKPCSTEALAVLGGEGFWEVRLQRRRAGSALNGGMRVDGGASTCMCWQSGGRAPSRQRFDDLGILDGGTRKQRRGRNRIGGAGEGHTSERWRGGRLDGRQR
jgi:hypothetical protein